MSHGRQSTTTRASKHGQNNSYSNNNNDNDRHHTAATLYGTQATFVATANPTTTTQFAGGKRSNDGYEP